MIIRLGLFATPYRTRDVNMMMISVFSSNLQLTTRSIKNIYIIYIFIYIEIDFGSVVKSYCCCDGD